MSKKVLLIGTLLIGLTVLFVTDANAYPPTLGGWGAWPKCVKVWSDWIGVANPDVKPTEVEVTIELRKVQLHYLNPAGQGGGWGQPFYPDVELTNEQKLRTEDLTSKGKAHSIITFSNEDLIGAIDPDSIPDPPNPQWYLDPDQPIAVLIMYVTIRGWASLDGDLYPEKEIAHVGGTCTLNYDRTTYICVTEESWGYKNNNPDCDLE